MPDRGGERVPHRKQAQAGILPKARGTHLFERQRQIRLSRRGQDLEKREERRLD